MKKMFGTTAAILTVSLALASCAGSLDINNPDEVGTLGDPRYGRETVITPDTKWVNVTQYETVRFFHTATGKSFTWDFQVRSWGKFNLSAVAPPGVIPPGQEVIVYIDEWMREGTNE